MLSGPEGRLARLRQVRQQRGDHALRLQCELSGRLQDERLRWRPHTGAGSGVITTAAKRGVSRSCGDFFKLGSYSEPEGAALRR